MPGPIVPAPSTATVEIVFTTPSWRFWLDRERAAFYPPPARPMALCCLPVSHPASRRMSWLLGAAATGRPPSLRASARASQQAAPEPGQHLALQPAALA